MTKRRVVGCDQEQPGDHRAGPQHQDVGHAAPARGHAARRQGVIEDARRQEAQRPYDPRADDEGPHGIGSPVGERRVGEGHDGVGRVVEHVPQEAEAQEAQPGRGDAGHDGPFEGPEIMKGSHVKPLARWAFTGWPSGFPRFWGDNKAPGAIKKSVPEGTVHRGGYWLTSPSSTAPAGRRLIRYARSRSALGRSRHRETVERRGIFPEEAVAIRLQMAREHAVEGADERFVVDPQAGDREIGGEDASFDAEDRYRFHDDASVRYIVPGPVLQAELGDLDVNVRLARDRLHALAPGGKALFAAIPR